MHDSTPKHPLSTTITGVEFDRYRYHSASGDMWPLTWASDGNLYGGAGDNRESPMNFWRIRGLPDPEHGSHVNDWFVDLIDNLPLDPAEYCTNPLVDRLMGIKPAGLIDLDGTLHFAVETQNYGTDPSFNRQTNIEGWIITSTDFGASWNRQATDQRNFFSGRVTSCHFLQYGQGGATPDGWLYAYFPGASDDGNSYWCNGDYVLLGRVDPGKVLDRGAWEFYTGLDADGLPRWDRNDGLARPVFEYPRMTGENHVSYNAGIGRYIMGNYSFVDDDMNPRPAHQGPYPTTAKHTQLTLFESADPWGPWSLFHRDDNWGTYGDYQPSFPVKWMFDGGRTMYLVCSGGFDDYNFTVQRLDLSGPALGRPDSDNGLNNEEKTA
jgi:hypothetical protein